MKQIEVGRYYLICPSAYFRATKKVAPIAGLTVKVTRFFGEKISTRYNTVTRYWHVDKTAIPVAEYLLIPIDLPPTWDDIETDTEWKPSAPVKAPELVDV